MSPPVHMIAGYARETRHIIKDVRGNDEGSTKTEGKRKDREGGDLPKLRLRSRILSHSFFTAPHAGDRERKGRRNKKATKKKRGSSETTMAISKTSQREIESDPSALSPPSTPARSMQSHNRQSPDE